MRSDADADADVEALGTENEAASSEKELPYGRVTVGQRQFTTRAHNLKPPLPLPLPRSAYRLEYRHGVAAIPGQQMGAQQPGEPGSDHGDAFALL